MTSKLVKRAVGSLIGMVIYNEFKDQFRKAEMRVRIRRHVKMAESVENKVDEVVSK